MTVDRIFSNMAALHAYAVSLNRQVKWTPRYEALLHSPSFNPSPIVAVRDRLILEPDGNDWHLIGYLVITL